MIPESTCLLHKLFNRRIQKILICPFIEHDFHPWRPYSLQLFNAWFGPGRQAPMCLSIQSRAPARC